MAIDEKLAGHAEALPAKKTTKEAVEKRSKPRMRRIAIVALCYVIPTFALGFVWHLVAFKSYYDALGVYRHDVLIPFGLLAITLQAVLFAWVLDSGFGRDNLSVARRGIYFAAFGAALSWSFTTLSVAAKNVMTSVPDYLLIESAFTIVHWAVVGPLMALVHARGSHTPLQPRQKDLRAPRERQFR